MSLKSKNQHFTLRLSICGRMCPLCLPFGKHAYFHLDPKAVVNVNQVGESESIDKAVQMELAPPSPWGLLNDSSLLLQRV